MIEAVSSEAGKAVTLSMSRVVGLAVLVELIGTLVMSWLGWFPGGGRF